jgi:outer membrane protein TolC
VLRDSRRAVLAARLQLLEAQTQSALADLQLLRATGGAGTSATTAP